MSHWKINLPGLLILSFIIFLMLLIVVLPDVDLPDAAFHNGTAPVAIHLHATAAPAAVIVAITCASSDLDRASGTRNDPGICFHHTRPNFRPILLRSIRC
jgi:hypothetical protein